ncbi:MAG: VWA domain-containing protein [Myxococcales bacterium]|nr:VWA domain-containing protein [Myxococcales bacterium]
MTLAQPILLLALGLLIPIVAAFLFRRRSQRLRVPSTLLWQKVAVSRARDRRVKNLRRLLALLACVVAAWALIVAAARPSPASSQETLAFVVDVSASMGRLEDEPLGRARAHIRDALRSVGPGDRVLIVAAGERPRHLAGPTSEAVLLERALERLESEPGRADRQAALRFAESLLSNERAIRLVLLHDGGEAAGASLEPSGHLEERVFESPIRDNLGLTLFAARAPEDPRSEDEREFLIAVASSSPRPRRARIRLEISGIPLASEEIAIPARAQAELALRLRSDSETITAIVEPTDGIPDALEADDRAQLELLPLAPPRVHLLRGEGVSEAGLFFVRNALSAAGVREIKERSALEPMGRAEPGDVAIVLGEVPALAPPLPTLYLGVTIRGAEGAGFPVSDPRALSAIRGETVLRSIEAHHSLTRGLDLDAVTIDAAFAIEPSSEARELIALDGGIVLAAGGVGRRRWIYFGLPPLGSDLVLRVAYPVFIANALSHLAGSSSVRLAETLPRAEVQLRLEPGPSALPEAAEPPLRLPLAPPFLLAAIAALLLGLEGFAWYRGAVR